jgi:hypothetical protein
VSLLCVPFCPLGKGLSDDDTQRSVPVYHTFTPTPEQGFQVKPSPHDADPSLFSSSTAMKKLRIVTGLARRDREWSLNDGQLPNPNVVRVAPGTGYHRVKGNRRASRTGPVSDLPPEILSVTIRNFFIAASSLSVSHRAPSCLQLDASTQGEEPMFAHYLALDRFAGSQVERLPCLHRDTRLLITRRPHVERAVLLLRRVSYITDLVRTHTGTDHWWASHGTHDIEGGPGGLTRSWRRPCLQTAHTPI